MRIIPKKIKVKNTVWKCYSMPDIIVALVVFAIIFIAITAGNWGVAVVMGLAAVVMFMPTSDGIFYSCILENIKFLISKKKYTDNATKEKEHINSIVSLKDIKENGLIEYNNGFYGRVIKIGQKNFGIEDIVQQNIDINYFANALKFFDGTQTADIVKIDRPVNLDEFSGEIFERLFAVKESDDLEEIKEIKTALLQERIDRIDKLNNIRKQYISDYYMVVYGRNEIDLENNTVNIASEINKCGLETKILGRRETATFLKYSYSRNFDEREIKEVEDNRLIEWVKPKTVEFKSNRYTIDGTEASVLSIADYPLRVKNAWGSELFNIPNTKVVMHVKPVDKYKAIKRIDKVIGEMETKQILSEKASEANSAETHRQTMHTLLDSLQTENESLLDVTLTITAYNYLDDVNYKKKVRRSMLTGNFKPSMLYGLQVEGFKSADVSPVSSLSNYERGINSSSLAAVFPFVRTFVMDKGGYMLGENKNNHYPFIFNLWKRGNLYQNSNGFVIGKSGSGKSYFLKNLILNEWANDTRIIVLDPEAEYLNVTRSLSGNIIDVGNAKEGRINPFHIYKVLTEDGSVADPVVTFNTHLKMLESFFKIVFGGAPVDVIELINNLAVETYERKGITETTDCTNFTPERFPIFSDMLETLKAKDKATMDALTLRDMRTAELYLQKFVNGRYSDIWNAPSTLQVDADLIDFNFQSLFANKNNTVANAQMLLVFRFIEQEVINARELNKNGKNLHTMIVCDEAHLFIDAKFPIALDFFFSMSKRIRKYGGSFIPATQNIADWNANEELRGKTSAIIKNSQYTFIFKLSAPDMKDVLDVYKVGESFNDDEQRMIISAITGQAFFIGSTELRASVKIISGEYAQTLFNEKNKRRKSMKTKKVRARKFYFLFAIFAVCLGCGLFFGGTGTTTAYAATATTPKYTMQLDYSIKTTTGSGGGSGTSYSTGTAYSAALYKSQSSVESVTVSLWGSSSSGTANFAKGSYINSSTVNLAINSSVVTGSITVKNSSGAQVGSGKKTLTLTGLANGLYSVEFEFGGAAWATSSRSGVSKYTSATSSFYVDSTAPTINGASTSTTGKYTNTAFTVSATDTGGSGISALYYKAPNASSYSSVASSITFLAGSTNGLYYFYTKDNAGNTSSTYYVYYDNTKPTGAVKNASGTTLTSEYTNGAFSYTASDSGSGISYLQYMKPNSSSWTSYVSGTTISATATNGKYQFRAVDKAGNISDTKTIYLDTVNPVGVLYSGTTAVSSGYKSTASYIKYVASDASSGIKTVYVKKPNASGYSVYTNGAQMTENGTYSFYCVDNIGNTSSTVTISLDNTKPTLSLSKGNFGDTLSDGFSVTATDNIGGTTLYYKTPSGAFVQSTSLTVTIPKTMENGTYQFYATDGYGNTSATYSVYLSIDAPVGTIVKSSGGNQVCFIWTDNACSATLDGESYVNGTWIKVEGNHTIVLKNDAARSTTYTFSIDHYYKEKTVVAPTCENDGYTVYECDNCGDTYKANYVAALGHNYTVTKTYESTCTGEGYSVYVCARCGDTYNDDITSANGHSFGSWYTVTDSDCLKTGTKRRDCVSCGAYETGEIEAKGHNYVATVTDPTCTEQGYTTHVCSRCGDNYVDTYVQASGHKYIAKVTAPTCEERGYTTQTCKVCGDSYVENYVEPHGHDYGAWRITAEATCLENGLRYKTCGTCKYKYNEAIPALGHDYETEVIEPTCVDKGYATHICSRCGTGYNDTFVNALGHDYKTKRVEPTCTEEGYIGQCCSRCSDTYKTEIIKATGHDYVEEYVAVTCTEEGCVKHICLSCGYEYRTDVVSPSGHSLETHILLASTCDEKGERYYGCTKCDYERIDEIPAKGHNYELAHEENVNGVIKRTYICSVCTDSYTQDMGAEYEKVSNYVEYLFDEYSPYMMWVFLATSGVWSIAMGIAIIIANKNEDKVKAKKMLVNYGIGLIVIFAILVACPYLVKGIAALVT